MASFTLKRLAAFASIALLTACTSACAPAEPGGDDPPVSTARMTPLPRRIDARASEVREGRLAFAPALRDWAPPGKAPVRPPRFQFLDGVERSLRLTKHEVIKNGGVFTGDVLDAPGSWVVLTHVDDAVAGTLYVPGLGVHRVRTRPGGELRLTELDANKIPREVLPLEPPASAPRLPPVPASPNTAKPPAAPPALPEGAEGDALGGTATTSSDGVPPALGDANTVVRIGVFYTAAAAAANGGTSGVEALINSAIATSNVAYSNSQVALTMQLAIAAQTSYSESNALATDLPRFTSTTDGYMDEVHATRNSVKADVMSLVVSNGTDAAGIGYLYTTSGAATFANYAFSVVVDDYADSNITLAHEVGHNMGCSHAAEDSGVGIYSYSLGYKFTAGGAPYRTVMAYAPGTRIPYFSNPNVSYLGTATGTSSANNALTLTTTKASIAALVGGLTASDQLWVPITTGDLDGDGQTDIIWRNSSTGRVIAWFMNGSVRTSTSALWSGDSAWVPVAAGDFNADGRADIIWRNSSTGRVIVWFMNGASMTSTTALWSGDSNWVPVAVGDLNADGKPDILWRYAATGRVIVWLMNGTTTSSTAQLWTGDSAWVPVGTGDSDGDGKTDIVWRNSTTGRVVIWYMNGTTMTSTYALWSGSSDWVPRATGSFNGDSGLDYVWRNSVTGRVILWFTNGTTLTSTTAIWE